jgi:hypothetical protein
MSTADYLNRNIQVLTPTLGLTKVTQNLFDPTVDALNANAQILDAAALIVAAPATATSVGKLGTIAFDAGFLYIATGTNQWKRVAIAAW